jgi:hypothetical protein
MQLRPSPAQAIWAIIALALLPGTALRVASAQETATPQAKQPEDDRFRFYLTDGTRITGRLSLPYIQLATEYGPLAIPAEKLVRAVPGLDQRPEEKEEIEQLVGLLGKGQKESDQAREELVAMGAAVRELLRQEREEADEKQQAEIDKVLTRLDELGDEAGDEAIIPEDRVRTKKFSAVGKILSDKFQIETRFGNLTVTMADVERLERVGTAGLPDARKSLDIDGTYLAQQRFKDSGIQVQPGDKVIVRAGGTISRSTSRIYTSAPDGNSRFGTFSQDPPILGGALVARIGNSGKILKVGSSSTFVAKQSGMLRFAIGMRPEFVGRYQFNGKYNLSVQVVRGGK